MGRATRRPRSGASMGRGARPGKPARRVASTARGASGQRTDAPAVGCRRYHPPMKIGIVLPMDEADGPGRRRLAADPEAGAARGGGRHRQPVGLRPPHLPHAGEAEDGIHEAWTLLSALAAVTERAALGTIVLGTGFRPPALTAKMAATLDEIANGRLILGLGTGWHEPEYTAFGYPFDHRAGRFEEALAIIVPLLRGERVTFDGRWHEVDDAVLIPPPPRPARLPGRMPILIAAKGERVLRLTARWRGRLERGLVRVPGRAVRRPPRGPRRRLRGRGPGPGDARGHRRASPSTRRPRPAAGPAPRLPPVGRRHHRPGARRVARPRRRPRPGGPAAGGRADDRGPARGPGEAPRGGLT